VGLAVAAWIQPVDADAEDSPDLLPDFAAKPVLGPVIDLTELVEGDFYSVKSRGFLGDHVGLALAQDPVWEGFPDWDELPALAAVVAFDLDSGARLWQVDFGETLGEEFADARFGDLTGTGDEAITLWGVNDFGNDAQYPAATISAAGEVVSKTGDLGGEPIGAANGTMLVWNDAAGRESLAAYRAEDLTDPIWQADADPYALDTTSHNDWTSTWWTAPDDEVIDVYTGQPTGLRNASGRGTETGHWLIAGPTDLALRLERDGSASLVDPKTGEPMWDQSAPIADGPRVIELRGETVLAGPSYSERSAHVWARDVTTGRVLWTATGRIAAVRGQTVLLGRGRYLTTRQIRSGRELARTRLPEEYSVLGAGAETFYIQAWHGERRQLTAYAIDGLRKLWTLDTSPELEEGATAVWYRWKANRLFAVFTADDRQTMRELTLP
jgi:hypothetical protein